MYIDIPMKKLVLLLSFFLSVVLVIAQPNTNYIDYHKHIILAEQQFLYYNTPSGAINKYKEIFSKWDRPFAKDCFIALQLACMMRDTASATFFFEKCFENGVEWNTVLVSQHVSQLFYDLAYKKEMGKLYNKHNGIYLQTIDTAYRNVVRAMFAREVELRGKAEYGPNGRSETLVAHWLKLEDSNMYALVNMIQNKGFPGEKRVGFYYYDQVDIDKSGLLKWDTYPLTRVFLSSHVSTMFFHHRCGYQLLKGELMQAVVEGELHPREYALMYEWSHAYFMEKHWDDEFHIYKCESGKWEQRYNFYLRPWYHSNDTALVNQHRLEIGISSLEHDEKKKQYAIENRLYLFFGMFQKI